MGCGASKGGGKKKNSDEEKKGDDKKGAGKGACTDNYVKFKDAFWALAQGNDAGKKIEN